MQALPTIGFLGTGTIASALVKGFCAAPDTPYALIVSPRNAARAQALATAYPQQVRVAASNQAVLDAADWVILAILPQQGEAVLPTLRFKPQHKVINLLAGKSLAQIRAWIGQTQTLIHMVPLPFVAERLGPIAIHPPQPEAEALFAPLGRIVAVQRAEEIHLLQAITALMAPYYTLLQEIVNWAGGHGLAELPSKAYTASFFAALSQMALQAEAGGLAELAAEMTPGGINELAKNQLEKRGAFAQWTAALEPAFERLEGKENS